MCVHVAGEQRLDLRKIVCSAESSKTPLSHDFDIVGTLNVIGHDTELLGHLIKLFELFAEGMSWWCCSRRCCDRRNRLAIEIVQAGARALFT